MRGGSPAAEWWRILLNTETSTVVETGCCLPAKAVTPANIVLSEEMEQAEEREGPVTIIKDDAE